MKYYLWVKSTNYLRTCDNVTVVTKLKFWKLTCQSKFKLPTVGKWKLTDAEGDEEVWLDDLALGTQEALGAELLGMVPEGGVHVHRVDVGHYLHTLRYRVASQLNIPVNINNLL